MKDQCLCSQCNNKNDCKESEEVVCPCCRKRPATKLCDFPTGVVTTSIDFVPRRTTCDRPLCDECAIHVAEDTDFCPKCMELYRDKFINWQKELSQKKTRKKLNIP